jgi:indole-3-glycerol phosphate synthase
MGETGIKDNILEKIAAYTRERVKMQKRLVPEEELKARILERAARENGPEFPFEKAFRGEDIHIISEVKHASPSKGLITLEFPYLRIARDYEKGGAAAISVLTEPKWFRGDLEFFREIAESVSCPCLRKDFVVDPYMIYEARAAGAQAILLITAILTDSELALYLDLCEAMKLSALVECHDETEIHRALAAGARVIGVNNRNLKDFSVDLKNSQRLRDQIPDNVIMIAESGIKSRKDIEILASYGVNGVLIGETLMTATDRVQKLEELRGVREVIEA